MTTAAESETSKSVRKSLFSVFFGRLTRTAAIPVVVVSLWLPVDGLGVPVCWIKRWSGLPCPGCGLTRSITCISQFHFQKAWFYHPFGFLIYALLTANILLMFAGRGRRRRVESWFAQNDRLIRPGYWILVTAFLIFGAIRFLTS